MNAIVHEQSMSHLSIFMTQGSQLAHETRHIIQKGQQNKNVGGEHNYTLQVCGEGIKSLDGYVIRNNHLLMDACLLFPGEFIYSKYAELSHLLRDLMVGSGMPLLAAIDVAPIQKLCHE